MYFYSGKYGVMMIGSPPNSWRRPMSPVPVAPPVSVDPATGAPALVFPDDMSLSSRTWYIIWHTVLFLEYIQANAYT